jgi:hypothetical protein
LSVEAENSEEQPVTLHLDGNGVVAPAIGAIEIALDLVAMVAASLPGADLDSHPEGSLAFKLKTQTPMNVRRQGVEAAVLSAAFRELTRGVREMLEQAYIYVMAIEIAGKTRSYDELSRQLADAMSESNSSNFPDLAAEVERRLPAALQFSKEFHSLQKVRNCLEHRAGVVGPKDVKGGTHLVLTLPRMKIYTEQNGEEVELGVGQHFTEATTVKMKLDIRRREFALGNRVEFTAAEFGEIAHGCWFFAQDLGTKLPRPETIVPTSSA